MSAYFLPAMLGLFTALWCVMVVQFIRIPARAKLMSDDLNRIGATSTEYVRALRIDGALRLALATLALAFYVGPRVLGHSDISAVLRSGAGIIGLVPLAIGLIESWGPVRRRIQVISRLNALHGERPWSRFDYVNAGLWIVGGITLMGWMLRNAHINDHPVLYWGSLVCVALMLVGFAWAFKISREPLTPRDTPVTGANGIHELKKPH